MIDRRHTSKRIHFGGLVWFWAIPREPKESPRQRFIRTYESLRGAVEQEALAAQTRKPWWRGKIVRIIIKEPGRWFLGIARH